MAPTINKRSTGKTGAGLTAKSSGRYGTVKKINMDNLAPKPSIAGPSTSFGSPGHFRQGNLTLYVPPVTKSETYSNLMKGTPRPVPTQTGRFYTSPVMNTPETRKSRFGILWLPIKKRNQKKDVVYNSHKDANYRERAPTMYNMSGDSTEIRQAKKDEVEPSSLALENIIALKHVSPVTSVSAATDTSDIISSMEEIHLENKSNLETDDKDKKIGDNEEQKFLDNKDDEKSQEEAPVAKRKEKKDLDKVDGVKISPVGNSENEQEADCGITCLHYTMQCCECVII